VNAEDRAALGTGPPFRFRSKEMLQAVFPDILKVVDHAHAIPGAIALIQVFQPGAGKAVTIEAVWGLGIGYLLAVLDLAGDAGFRFIAVIAPTAGTRLFISRISAAQAAIHPASGDQLPAHRTSVCRSFWRHVCILMFSHAREVFHKLFRKLS
jgi:hypothetical protein